MNLYWILREFTEVKEEKQKELEELEDEEKWEEITSKEDNIAWIERKKGVVLWIEVVREEDDTYRYGVELIISNAPFIACVSKGRHDVEKIRVDKKEPLDIQKLSEDVKDELLKALLKKYFGGDVQ